PHCPGAAEVPRNGEAHGDSRGGDGSSGRSRRGSVLPGDRHDRRRAPRGSRRVLREALAEVLDRYWVGVGIAGAGVGTGTKGTGMIGVGGMTWRGAIDGGRGANLIDAAAAGLERRRSSVTRA